MSRALAVGFSIQVVVLGALLTLAADVYAHKRVEQLGGVNIWGYRGATAKQKRANEVRVGVVGGTTAFGWGVAAEESMITTVRRLVSLAFDRPGQTATYVTGYNIALPGLRPHEYPQRIEKFADLEFDVLCIYPDVVSTPTERTLIPKASGVEALTGYTPILPLVLDEKGIPLAGGVMRGFDATTYRLFAASSDLASDPLESVLQAIDVALNKAHGVVVIMPVGVAGQLTGYERLADRVATALAGETRLLVVDAAGDQRLQDPALRLNDVSFGAGGNALVGELASPAVIELLRVSKGQS